MMARLLLHLGVAVPVAAEEVTVVVRRYAKELAALNMRISAHCPCRAEGPCLSSSCHHCSLFQECGDFKRGACFRASCKFLHNGRPASEFSSGGNAPGAQVAGLPTPRAAGAFLAPPDLDHNLYDPNTGFGCFGTSVFGTRYGMTGALPKIENVRPLCMDFFKQGFCNRRGPHNQGCLFRHDEIEGKGKIVDEQSTAQYDEMAVNIFTAEANGKIGIYGKYASTDLEEAAKQYAAQREKRLVLEEAQAELARKHKEQMERQAAEAAERAVKARAEAAEKAEAVAKAAAAAGGGDGAGADGEPPLPAGWKPAKHPDGRTYYYHAATKKTMWKRPKEEDTPAAPAAAHAAAPDASGADEGVPAGEGAEEGGKSGSEAAADGGAPAAAAAPAEAVGPLPAGWKEAKAPDGRTYYYASGEKTRWTRPTAPTAAAAAAAAAALPPAYPPPGYGYAPMGLPPGFAPPAGLPPPGFPFPPVAPGMPPHAAAAPAAQAADGGGDEDEQPAKRARQEEPEG